MIDIKGKVRAGIGDDEMADFHFTAISIDKAIKQLKIIENTIKIRNEIKNEQRPLSSLRNRNKT